MDEKPFRNWKIVFRVQESAGCPVYKPGDRLVFSFPTIDTAASSPVCAHVAGSAYGLALALSKGVPYETLGEGKEGEGIYYCPGGVGRRVVFAVSRTEDAGSAPVRESSITMVMTRREKEKVEGIEKPREKDKDVDFILQHLKKIELFSPLPEASLEKMIPVLELKRFADSTPIIQQGEKGKYLFILIKGSVEVVQKTAEGFENVLATLSKGEVFGEMSLISGEPCSATVKASSPVSVLTISKENFDRILSENPSLNIYFNQLLVQRLRKQNVHVDEEISRGMLGKLSTFTLPELAQAISMNSRTGTLVLYNQDLRGEILFRNGQVVDAVSGALKAEEAFFDLLTWKDGNFRFKPGDIAAQRVVRMDTMGLLMEGLRRLDEKKMKA